MDEFEKFANASTWIQYVQLGFGILLSVAAIAGYKYERPKNARSRTLARFVIAVSFLLICVTFGRDRIDQHADELARALADARVAEASRAAASAFSLAQEQAPRRLSEVQIQEVLEILSAGEKGDFDLIVVAADPDTKQFAANIARMLQHTGWRRAMTVGEMRGVESRGVRIGVADVSHPPARALTLHAALNQVGINARLAEEEHHVPLSVRTQSTDYVELMIGSK